MKTIRIVLWIILTVFFLSGVAAWSQTVAPQVSLAGTEHRTLTSAKIGQRFSIFWNTR